MPDRPLRIASLGARAARLLTGDRPLRAASVFARSLYLTDGDGGFLCVGATDIGEGPLSALLDTAFRGWAAYGIVAGPCAGRVGTALRLPGGAALDWSAARVWQPAPWPPVPSRDGLARSLATLASLAAAHPARAGLMDVARAGTASLEAAFYRTAGAHMAALAGWLDLSLAGATADDAGRDAVRGLLGLGPGLTPSGDDCLSGCLIALHALGRGDLAGRLGAFIAAAPADATSPISAALLACAAAGEPGEALHALIGAVLEANEAAMPAAVDRLAGVGHTSGWDMLAGVSLALRAHANQPDPAGRQAPRISSSTGRM